MITDAKWIGKKTGELAFWKTTPFDETLIPVLTEKASVDEASTVYRKKFSVCGEVKRVTLRICGLGQYVAYLNGELCDADRVMAPVQSHYYALCRYDTYDVTHIVRDGENTVSAQLTGGWFAPAKKWWGWRMTWYGNPRLIAELEIEYADGRCESITTDESWQFTDGHITHNCIFDGETADFNLLYAENTEWKSAVEVEAPTDNLIEAGCPPVLITKRLQPIRVIKHSDTVFVYDFGENNSAVPHVTVKGAKGDRVTLTHAEYLSEDETLNTHSNGEAACRDEYVLSGRCDDILPRMMWHCYRYMMITLSSPDIEIIIAEACVVHSDVKLTGTFECSREDINRLHEVYLRTTLACMQGVPLDCPQRDERKAWLGDAHVTAEMCLYNFDMHDFYRSWLEDMRLGRDKNDKTVQHICPNIPKPITSIDWNIAYPTILLEQYKRYADSDILEHHYTALCEHVGYYISKCEDGMIPPCWFGDWFTIDMPDGMELVSMTAGPVGHRQNPPFAGTVFFCRTLRMTAEIADILGRAEDAAYYRELCEISKKALCERHYDAESGVFGSGGQFLQTIALAEHIVPDEDREKVFDRLLEAFEETDFHPLLGVVGTRLVFDVLAEFERQDVAYRIMTAEGFPGAFDRIGHGRTTLPECYDGGGSGCHCMFASPDTFFYKTFAGITVDRTAKDVITVKPYCPDDIDYVKCTQTLDEGTLYVEWRREEGRIVYTIDVPCGISVKLSLAGDGKDHASTAFEGYVYGKNVMTV